MEKTLCGNKSLVIYAAFATVPLLVVSPRW